MTVPRMAGSVHAVLADVLYNLTDAELQAWTGKTRNHFAKVSNPANRFGLHLEDAAALDAALLSKNLPARFREIFDQMTQARLGGATPRQPVDLAAKLRHLAIEEGELNAAVDQAMADGRLSTNERRQIARAAQDVADVAVVIRDAVEPPFEPENIVQFGAAE